MDIFLKRPRGGGEGGGGGQAREVLLTMAYTGRLRPKRKPYLGFMYIKEWGFTS